MSLTTRALAFASRWFDEGTVRRVFEPLVADWQREWQNAPASRRWSTSLSGLWAFIVATIVSFPRIVLTSAPPSVMNRVVTRVARFTLLGSALLVAPFVLDLPGAWLPASMVLFVVPQALTAVFPFAMVSAVDAIRRHEALPPHIERAAVTRLGLTAVLLMLILGGWVTPAANQAWRRATAPPGVGEPVRGHRELTTIELIVDPSHAHAGDTTNAGGRAAALRRELNSRVSFAVLPVLVLWLRWRSLDLPRRRWSPLPAGIAAVAIIGGYVLLRGFVEDGLSMPREAGAWFPLVMFVVVSILRQHWAGRQARGVA